MYFPSAFQLYATVLVWHFVNQFSRRMNKCIDTIPSETIALVRAHWPGNARELQNVIERGVIVSIGPDQTPKFEVNQKTLTKNCPAERLAHSTHFQSPKTNTLEVSKSATSSQLR